eukprot:4906984-Alexandrium_andersonii.AAC.1
MVNGERIAPDDTAEKLGLEDGGLIDVTVSGPAPAAPSASAAASAPPSATAPPASSAASPAERATAER